MHKRRASDIVRTFRFDGTLESSVAINKATDNFAWYERRNDLYTMRLCVIIKGGALDYADAGSYIGICADGSLVIQTEAQHLAWLNSNG